jgi:uncharacterized Tic20 family protein
MRKVAKNEKHRNGFNTYFLGNFPILFWTSKDESEFVDYSGKQILNFQL